MNHSCNPNVLASDLGFEIAIRDILPGEKMTNDYANLGLPLLDLDDLLAPHGAGEAGVHLDAVCLGDRVRIDLPRPRRPAHGRALEHRHRPMTISSIVGCIRGPG